MAMACSTAYCSHKICLVLQERKSFVPYRNSLLTLLLRDSLGGNCRTVMVATVTPEAPHIDESISTCRQEPVRKV